MVGAVLLVGACSESAPGLTPEEFGARGDGRRDDSLAFTRALRACREQARPLTLRNGAEYVASGLDVSATVVRARGARIRQPVAQAGVPVIKAEGAFTWTGGEIVAASRGAKFRGPVVSVIAEDGDGEIRLSGVSITGHANVGVRLTASSRTSRLTAVLDSVSVRGGRMGIQLRNLTGSSVTNCSVTGVTSHGIWAQGTDGLTIKAARVERAGGDGIAIAYCKGFAVQTCVVRKAGKSGISAGGGDPSLPVIRDFEISGNTTTNCHNSGITVDPTLRGSEGVPVEAPGTISDNISRGNRLHGIVITCARDVDVRDNVCSGNQLAGISLATGGAYVSSNDVRGNLREGIALRGASNLRYRGNILRDNRGPVHGIGAEPG